ncbi:MAG: 50S ribosomal protein L35 [Thermomicrobiales bacterium]|nr:50S ribosomal protein L35 [Thermomicrobiales bacterium]
MSKLKNPKMKTHKGAKKRFDITGTGQIRHAKGMKSHFRRRKAPRTKRLFDRMIVLEAADRKRIKRLLPYGVK